MQSLRTAWSVGSSILLGTDNSYRVFFGPHSQVSFLLGTLITMHVPLQDCMECGQFQFLLGTLITDPRVCFWSPHSQVSIPPRYADNQVDGFKGSMDSVFQFLLGTLITKISYFVINR